MWLCHIFMDQKVFAAQDAWPGAGSPERKHSQQRSCATIKCLFFAQADIFSLREYATSSLIAEADSETGLFAQPQGLM